MVKVALLGGLQYIIVRGNEAKTHLTPFTRREMAMYAGGCAVLLSALFCYNLLTIAPPFTPINLALYAFFTVALIVEYGFIFTHMEQAFPAIMPMMAFWIAVEGVFMYGIILVLGLRASPYIFLLIFDGYSAATITSRKVAAVMTMFLAAVVGVSFVVLFGARQGGLIFADHLVWIILAVICAEIFVRQWRQRFQVERLMTQLEEAHEQLRDYTAKSEELAIARERVRLARDLHDTVGHSLTALDIQMELLSRLPDDEATKRRKITQQSRGLVKEGLIDLHRAVQALRPLALDSFSLVDAVGRLIDDFKRDLPVTVLQEIDPSLQSVAPTTAMPIYRAVQEALTNIRRHAPNASQVDILLMSTPAGIRLVVTNDGALKVDAPGGNGLADDSGYGLRGIQERITAMGGTFRFGIENGVFRLELTLETNDGHHPHPGG